MSKPKFFLATIKHVDVWVPTLINQTYFVLLAQRDDKTFITITDVELECQESFDEMQERLYPKVKEYTLDFLTTTFAKNLMIIIIVVLFSITISKLIIKN